MSTISITKLYDLLSVKLGKETAENLTTFIDNKINEELESKIQHLATKEDLAKLEAKLESRFSDIIRWMFVFWVGQLAVTISLILILRK